jgi:UDP-N-acetylmuramoyl-L-alanyl-D-glutamate--2,6-diaminopimelate ligase
MDLIDMSAETSINDQSTTTRPSAGLKNDRLIIAGLTSDSRQVKPGYLFAALPGETDHGQNYIADAIANGAVAVLGGPETSLPNNAGGTELIRDKRPRRRFARIAAAFYDRQPDCVSAVTGTNGKTSVVHFANQLWRHAGYHAASLGTLGVLAPDLNFDGPIRVGPVLTTPDPVTLHEELADLADAGVTHLAMEASSHGLDQHRLDGIDVSVAGFTNLSQDHLDYHGDMDTYFAAKKRLFIDILSPDGAAVINADEDIADELITACEERGQQVIRYGRKGREIRLLALQPTETGQDLRLDFYGQKIDTHLNMIGDYQALNLLCALGLVTSREPDPVMMQRMIDAIPELTGAKGRLEHIADHPNGGAIYVDYAHTPGALEATLKTIRRHALGQVHVVFGCGGNRDQSKRSIMGQVADQLADHIIVTDDNPRHEDPASIRAMVLQGAVDAIEIPDRAKAIEEGIHNVGPDDILLVAGKGHETGQKIGGKIIPFSDADTIIEVVGKLDRDAG